MNVLDLIAAGASATAAARQAGVHRNTVSNWIHTDVFQAALQQARAARDVLLRDAAQPLLDRAIAAIGQIMENPDASPSVRLRAAIALFDRAARYVLPDPADLPLPDASPAPEIVQPMHNNAQAEPAPAEMKPPARAQAANPDDQPTHDNRKTDRYQFGKRVGITSES
jgi:hypothetical protein